MTEDEMDGITDSMDTSLIQLQLIFLWVLETFKPLPLTPHHQSLTTGAQHMVGA